MKLPLEKKIQRSWEAETDPTIIMRWVDKHKVTTENVSSMSMQVYHRKQDSEVLESKKKDLSIKVR